MQSLGATEYDRLIYAFNKLFYHSSELEIVCSNNGSHNLIISVTIISLLSSLALFCGDFEADLLVISALV